MSSTKVATKAATKTPKSSKVWCSRASAWRPQPWARFCLPFGPGRSMCRHLSFCRHIFLPSPLAAMMRRGPESLGEADAVEAYRPAGGVLEFQVGAGAGVGGDGVQLGGQREGEDSTMYCLPATLGHRTMQLVPGAERGWRVETRRQELGSVGVGAGEVLVPVVSAIAIGIGGSLRKEVAGGCPSKTPHDTETPFAVSRSSPLLGCASGRPPGALRSCKATR